MKCTPNLKTTRWRIEEGKPEFSKRRLIEANEAQNIYNEHPNKACFKVPNSIIL